MKVLLRIFDFSARVQRDIADLLAAYGLPIACASVSAGLIAYAVT